MNIASKSVFDTSGRAYDIDVSGNYAYVADNTNGLLIVDITDSLAPKLAEEILKK
jgi:hypothetical protein